MNLPVVYDPARMVGMQSMGGGGWPSALPSTLQPLLVGGMPQLDAFRSVGSPAFSPSSGTFSLCSWLPFITCVYLRLLLLCIFFLN